MVDPTAAKAGQAAAKGVKARRGKTASVVARKTPANRKRAIGESTSSVYLTSDGDSGVRHTRDRRIDASVRRQGERQTAPLMQPVVESESSRPFDDEDDDDVGFEHELEAQLDMAEDVVPTDGVPTDGVPTDGVPKDGVSFPITLVITKGTRGRFVRSESSSTTTPRFSKRHKQLTDDSWMVKGHTPGGPTDDSVIPSFGGHVARQIWDGVERRIEVLKCQNRSHACSTLRSWLDEFSDDLRRRVDATGLSHLPFCMFPHIDMPLISAFVERWQPDTSTFHMPFGEMTIMLHDVWHILRIPVEGRFISAESSSEHLKCDMVELLGVSFDELKSPHWVGGGVAIETIIVRCHMVDRTPDTSLVGWMFLMLGTSLFVDKSGSRIRPSSILELKDGGVDSVTQYSWGAATLAFLYRQLGVASRGGSQGISGCLTLLQAWIYEYFPTFRPHTSRLTCEPGTARACMWSIRQERRSLVRLQSFRTSIDQLMSAEVTWLPYGPDPALTVPRTTLCGWLRYRDIIEPYMPDRVLRQLGYMQVIPSPILRPELSSGNCLLLGLSSGNCSWTAAKITFGFA
ncbi:protein MAIN-LIKE 1-like [Spinacia oleracea]|uniref:Protein MAIN-LIKE 1-like n=1 Tax=Spinacia oleracea TaxID=3562 RepID=A0ABM3R0H3_SPIOL|nr:protein MAIN-LIKE 1-like [Spinacia oleracea]